MNIILSGGMLLSLAAIFCWADTPAQPEEKKTVTPSGLTIIERAAGTGVAAAGDTVWVHYTGKLENGTKFDSSADHDQTRNDGISFTIGKGMVIKGWDEGISGMKVGDKRTLIIPSNLAYGAAGQPPTIPPNATLVFDVELIGLKRVAG